MFVELFEYEMGQFVFAGSRDEALVAADVDAVFFFVDRHLLCS